MTTQKGKPGRKRSPEMQAVYDQAAANGIDAKTLYSRLKHGWSPKEAATTPTAARGHRPVRKNAPQE
ncbi:hypothetical protein [Paenibacillus humicus]|uniref:hypothetical protein n=1 Tax=Paenibacillus humicus TaxID=412861 RepID=UPI003F191AAA